MKRPADEREGDADMEVNCGLVIVLPPLTGELLPGADLLRLTVSAPSPEPRPPRFAGKLRQAGGAGAAGRRRLCAAPD